MAVNSEIFDTFPVLHTKRLTLRDIRPADASMIYKMRSNGLINQFIPRDDMGSEEESTQLIERTIDAYRNKKAIGWAGLLRDDKQIIGTCGFNQIDYHNLRAEIGGELSVNYWGKHIALEAMMAIVEFGFAGMNLHSIEAKVSPDNRGAIFLLKKIGFRKEAHFVDRIYRKGEFSDLAVYTLIKGNGNFDLGRTTSLNPH